MNRTIKIISVILCVIVFVYEVIGIFKIGFQFSYNIDSSSAYVVWNIYQSITSILSVVIILCSCIFMLLHIWKGNDRNKTLSFVFIILLGCNNLIYSLIGTINFGFSFFFEVIFDIPIIVAGILLIISEKKCKIPYIIAISVCAVVGLRGIAGLSIIATGILMNVVSTRNEKYNYTTETLTQLKNQFDEHLISEEEYNQKKSEVLSKLNKI